MTIRKTFICDRCGISEEVNFENKNYPFYHPNIRENQFYQIVEINLWNMDQKSLNKILCKKCFEDYYDKPKVNEKLKVEIKELEDQLEEEWKVSRKLRSKLRELRIACKKGNLVLKIEKIMKDMKK